MRPGRTEGRYSAPARTAVLGSAGWSASLEANGGQARVLGEGPIGQLGAHGRNLGKLGIWVILWSASAGADDQCSGDPVTGFDCPADGAGGGGLARTPIGQSVSAVEGIAAEGIAAYSAQREREEARAPSGWGAGTEGRQFRAFATAFGTSEKIDQRRTIGANSDAYGGILGFDYGGDKSHAGVAIYYENTDVKYDDDAGKTHIDQYGVEIFGYASPLSGSFVGGAASISSDQYDTKRNISVEDALGEINTTRAVGKTDGITFSAIGGGGYQRRVFGDFSVGLSNWLDYSKVDVDGYDEKGATNVDPFASDVTPNLSYDSDDFNRLRSIVELNLTSIFSYKATDFQPSLSLLYFHEWISGPRTIRAQLIGTDAEILYETNELDENYFGLAGGLTVSIFNGWLGHLGGDVILGHSYWDSAAITLGVSRYF
jgi:uncharacterized protein YhjY with autotransporter beta-barrel domain